MYLVLSLDLVLQRNQLPYHLLARAILTDITGVAETYIPSSIPRLHSIWYIHNIWGNLLIQISTSHQHTLVAWSCNFIWNSITKVCWYGSCRWYCCTIWKCNSQICSRRSEGTVLFDTKGASAFTALNQVYGYYGDDKDPGTSGITTISGVGITKNTGIWILWRRQRSIWNIYILQYTSRTSRSSLYSFNWYWCCSPLSDRWNCTRIIYLRQLRDSRKIQRTCKC